MVLAMVVVGGLTRLTESGLSITEWKPITGIIPPLSDADWQAEFEAYQQIPQYQVLNQGMTLDEFKFIYFWEWFHRALGRVIGLVFAVPFLIFLVQRRFTWNLAAPLAGLFVLGGLQGALGWWMVTSGLTTLTSVSQYRLAAHLAAALLLFIALVWVARRLTPRRAVARADDRASALILLVLVILQVGAGAFVAGLDAGMGYNTWPLMDGALVPDGLGVDRPMVEEFVRERAHRAVHPPHARLRHRALRRRALDLAPRAGRLAAAHRAARSCCRSHSASARWSCRCRCRSRWATRRWPSCSPAPLPPGSPTWDRVA